MKRVQVILFGAVVAACLTAGISVGGSALISTHQASAFDFANQSNDPICIAVPIFTNYNKGKCQDGEQEIPNDKASGGAIVYYVKQILKLISGFIGGIIILMLVISGVQYIASAGDPNLVKTAKGHIQGALIALVLFLMMFAILNFLVPGGVLGA